MEGKRSVYRCPGSRPLVLAIRSSFLNVFQLHDFSFVVFVEHVPVLLLAKVKASGIDDEHDAVAVFIVLVMDKFHHARLDLVVDPVQCLIVGLVNGTVLVSVKGFQL